MLVMGVWDMASCLREEGREKSRDVGLISIKVNTLKLVRWEKASLSMLEMGLKDNSSRLRLFKFGFVKWKAEIEVILLCSAERRSREEGKTMSEIERSSLSPRASSLKAKVKSGENAAGSMFRMPFAFM